MVAGSGSCARRAYGCSELDAYAQPRRAADAPISVVLLCWHCAGAPLTPVVDMASFVKRAYHCPGIVAMFVETTVAR